MDGFAYYFDTVKEFPELNDNSDSGYPFLDFSEIVVGNPASDKECFGWCATMSTATSSISINASTFTFDVELGAIEPKVGVPTEHIVPVINAIADFIVALHRAFGGNVFHEISVNCNQGDG